MRRTCLLIGTAVLLAGCATAPKPGTVYRYRTVTVDRPVFQPCADPRPTSPKSMVAEVPDAAWNAMTRFERDKALGQKAIEIAGYAGALKAATAACPEVKGN